MDKRLCERVLQHFDFKTIETLNDYISMRLDKLYVLLSITKEIDTIRQIQGSIEELNRLKKLRDDALALTQQER